MALLWIDGFEGYGTSLGSNPSPSGVMGRRYTTTSETTRIFIETGRFGRCVRFYQFDGASFKTPALTTNATMIIGFAFKTNSVTNFEIAALYDGATKGCNIYMTSGGELAVRRGSTTLGTSSGLSLTTGTWYWVELKILCNDTTGTYELKVNETTEVNGTGADTKEGSNNYHDSVKFTGSTTGSPILYFDDFYVCDGSGSQNNNFLGNSKVVAIFPDGDDTANWATSSPSANHYENVDETVADDDTSYVQDGTTNTLDLYDYEALTGGFGTIHGLQINTDCKETDATSFDLKSVCKSSSTQSDGTANTIGSTSYTTITRIVEQDPNTSAAWTESGINAAKFGIKVG